MACETVAVANGADVRDWEGVQRLEIELGFRKAPRPRKKAAVKRKTNTPMRKAK